MSQKNKWQKQCEKKLSLENLESRQLLSAVPLTANPDLVDAAAIYAPVSNDAYVDFSDTEEAQVALQDEVSYDDYDDEAVIASAVGNKLSVSFEAEGNQQYSVVFWGYDIAADKDTITVKNVKPSAKKIQDGRFTYSYTGKANTSYTIVVVKGKLSAKQIQDYEIPEEYEYVGSTGTYTIPTYKFAAKPGTATENSVTFQQKADNKTAPWYEIFALDSLVFSAKFDGAKKASVYTVEDGCLLLNGEETPYSIGQNDDGSVTISGLASNTKQSFQVAVTNPYENSTSAYSSNLTIATTKVQMTAPSGVYAELNYDANYDYDGSATVSWLWFGEEEVPPTFTVSYSYTDAKGKVVTKNVTNKATLNVDEYEGNFTVSKLASGTKYTFSVSANKTKDLDASAFVAAGEPVITPTTIPAPTLKKVSATDTTITLQITNWDKMGTALQEVDEFGEGGTIEITNGNVNMETGEGFYAAFKYYNNGNADEAGWVLEEGDSDESKMEISVVKKKSNALVTIAGLDANTEYFFQANAFSFVINDNVNTVAVDKSKSAPKPIKSKTEITAYPPVTNLTTSDVTEKSVTVSWAASKPKGDYLVTLTSETGKIIKKTAKSTSINITGLTPATTYTVAVVAKGDKNGSESEPATTFVKTNELIQVKKAVSIGKNAYAMEFGRDMTQCSGRLDFSLKGSGRAFAPQDGQWHSDTFSDKYSFFFGENAQYEAISYQIANPSANVFILNDDNTISSLGEDALAPVTYTQTEVVQSSKYNIDADITTELQFRESGYTTLKLDASVNYKISANLTATFSGGVYYDPAHGTSGTIKAGIKMKFAEKNY